MAGIFLTYCIRPTFKIAALAALILFTYSQPAQATNSRVSSLGGGGDYFEDDSNVLRWYGSLVDYPNQAVLESGNFTILDGYWHSSTEKHSGPGLGAHLALGQDGRFGTAAFFYNDSDEDRTTAIQQDHLRDNLSFLYALDLGPLTAAVTYRHGALTTEVMDSTTELSIDTFGTGLRMDLGSSAYLDLAAEIRKVHETRNWDPGFEENDDNGLLAFRARAFVGLGPRLALVPLAEIIDEDRQGGSISRYTISNQLLRMGLGLNYFPDTDHLLLLSAEYSDYSEASDFSYVTVTDNWSTLIVKAGFESRMLSWLTTRGSLGFVDYSISRDIEPDGNPDGGDGFDGPILRVNLGASIHLGPVDLDFAFWEKHPQARNIVRDLVWDDRWISITARFLF